MSKYLEIIRTATHCNDADCARIEEIMRTHIFCSTLDWQTRPQLIRAALKAKAFMEFERSLEGIAMAERVEKEMLA
jgi:hypothetical protein